MTSSKHNASSSVNKQVSGTLSIHDEARLLSGAVTRRSTREISVLVVPPIFIVFYSQSHDATALVWWMALFLVMALLSALARRRFSIEQKTLSDEVLLRRWRPVFILIWGLFGAAWSVPVLITLGNAPFEFTLMLYMSLSGTTALAATSLAAVFRGFQVNFVTCWGVVTIFSYWSFPQHWMYIYPLTIIYGAAIYQHAKGTNRFVLEQLELEKHSTYLAEQYRIARDDSNNALQAKSQFLATASHDLRQPVHAMGLLIEAARRRNKSADIAPLLNELQDCVRSVNLMFNSLLDLSKLEAGVMPSRPQLIDLAGVVKDVEVMFRDDAIRRNLSLRFHMPRNARARVQADPALLRQAVFNLVQNALRYTRHGGVLVSVRKREANWMIEVWDTGVGVAAVDRERIFIPYERRSNAAQMESEGLGLGLAVVKRCVAMMNAGVGLSSVVGRGSRFWIHLPQANVIYLSNSTKHTKPVHRQGERNDEVERQIGGCCLIVEDDPMVIAAWSALLDEWGITTRFAGGTTEALTHIRQGFIPEVILCDQRLRNGESGYSVLQELLSRVPAARGAIVSGEHGSTELQQAEQDGYIVLRKPVNTSQLYALLSTWMPS